MPESRRTGLILILVLLALLAIPSMAQETKPTFCPTVQEYDLNSYTTLYRIQDSGIVCYWMVGFQSFGLSCVVREKEFPPMESAYNPIVVSEYKNRP